MLQGNDGVENVNFLPSWLGDTSSYATLRDWLDKVQANFYGEALRCQDNRCNIENVNIYGFDTGVEAVGAPSLYMHHMIVDANTCYQFHNIGDETQGGDLRCFPVVTGGSNNSLQWSVTSVSSGGGGACRLHVTGGDAVNNLNWFKNLDTVWVSKLAWAPGCNGRWIVGTSSHSSGSGDLNLVGSSYAGPTTTAILNTGSSILTVVASLDNVYGQQTIGGITVPGQYICASGTAPYCAAPTGIAGGSGRASTATTGIPNTTWTGAVTVTSTANWPASGYVQAGSETMSYTLINSTSINITAREQDGTTAAAHTITPYTVTPATPTVVTIWSPPGSIFEKKVVMSQPAIGSAFGATIKFLNDNTLAGSVNGTLSDYATDRFWTYNQAVGPWTATDATGLPSCTQPTPNSSVNGQLLAPGNCPATGFLIGGHIEMGDDTHGVTFTNPFSYAHEIQFHLWNSHSAGLFGSGSDAHGELNDSNVISYWFDGITDRTKIDLREMHSAFIDILQDSTTQDCNAVSGSQMDVAVASAHLFENDLGCLILSLGSNDNPALALVAHASSKTILGLDNMPNLPIYFESSVAAGNTLADASDVFATGNFAAWCNPQYAIGSDGCVKQAVQPSGEFALQNPSASTVWAYRPSANLVLQPHSDQITAVAFASALDLTANINVITAIATGTGARGVMLPLSTKATDLVANSGAGGCMQVVNSTSSSITVWDHSSETITNGSMPVSGSSGVPLAAWKNATFCPVSGVGWVGN